MPIRGKPMTAMVTDKDVTGSKDIGWSGSKKPISTR